jgi:hypothetical protein
LDRWTSEGRAVNPTNEAAIADHVFAARVAPTRAAKRNLHMLASSAGGLLYVSDRQPLIMDAAITQWAMLKLGAK